MCDRTGPCSVPSSFLSSMSLYSCLSKTVSIKYHVAFVIDKLTKVVVIPQRSEHRSVGSVVVVPENFPQIACRLLPMIPGHHWEEMVNDMKVSHVMKEESSLPSKEVAVDGCSRSALIVPQAFAIMRKLGIRVMQVGDHDKPMSDEQPRDTP